MTLYWNNYGDVWGSPYDSRNPQIKAAPTAITEEFYPAGTAGAVPKFLSNFSWFDGFSKWEYPQIIHFKRLPLQTIHFGHHFRKPPLGCLKIGYTHQIVTLTKSTMITMIQHQAQCSGKSMAFHLWDPGQSAWPPQFMDDLRHGGCLKWGYPK